MTFTELEEFLIRLKTVEEAAHPYAALANEGYELLQRHINGKKLSSTEQKRLHEIEASPVFCGEATQTYVFSKKHMFEWQAGTFHIRQQERFCLLPPHRHDYVEMTIVYAGQCRQFLNGALMVLEPGDVLLMDMQSEHMPLPLGEGDIILNFLIKPEMFGHRFFQSINDNDLLTEFFSSLLREEHRTHPLLFHCNQRERFWSVFRIMLCEYFENDSSNLSALVGCFPILFAELLRAYRDQIGGSIQSTQTQQSVEPIVRYIKANYRTCTAESVARRFGYSKAYLGTLLRNTTGQNFTDMRLQYRLLKATELLSESDTPIADIAEQIGYSNLSYFYRIFKERYGMTPQAYRERYKNPEHSTNPEMVS